MTTELSVEKKFATLCEISRAQHFAWREAVRQMFPETDTAEVVKRMWEVTGEQTGRAYVKHIDADKPLAAQVAASICWSSDCMGEDATVEPGKNADESYVRHRACPWLGWHERLGLQAEDRPGCDAWFQSTIDLVNKNLGTKLQFETCEALPDGGESCLRRIWVESESLGERVHDDR